MAHVERRVEQRRAEPLLGELTLDRCKRLSVVRQRDRPALVRIDRLADEL